MFFDRFNRDLFNRLQFLFLRPSPFLLLPGSRHILIHPSLIDKWQDRQLQLQRDTSTKGTTHKSHRRFFLLLIFYLFFGFLGRPSTLSQVKWKATLLCSLPLSLLLVPRTGSTWLVDWTPLWSSSYSLILGHECYSNQTSLFFPISCFFLLLCSLDTPTPILFPKCKSAKHAYTGSSMWIVDCRQLWRSMDDLLPSRPLSFLSLPTIPRPCAHSPPSSYLLVEAWCRLFFFFCVQFTLLFRAD